MDIWAVGPAIEGMQRTVWHSEGWNGGAAKWVATATTPGANTWDADPSFNAVLGKCAR